MIMIIATLIGTIFWVTYGFIIKSMPVAIMNGVFGIIVINQFYLKIRYHK